MIVRCWVPQPAARNGEIAFNSRADARLASRSGKGAALRGADGDSDLDIVTQHIDPFRNAVRIVDTARTASVMIGSVDHVPRSEAEARETNHAAKACCHGQQPTTK